jgi:hypothetical protein
LAFQGLDPDAASDDAWAGALLTADHHDEIRKLRAIVEAAFKSMAKRKRRR